MVGVGSSGASDPRQPTGRDILVVDDSQTNLVAIEAALLPLGRTLVLVHSGLEALARLVEQDFGLIVLDVAMPGLDGFETAKRVRSRDRSRSTPIILVTGLSWQDDAVLRGYELGAFECLATPVRAEVLRAKASVFVELQERTLELQQKGEELRRQQARNHEHERIARRERFEAEVLEKQMAQLAEADRRKDEFLAILSHELRNPLQPLQTAVEVLEHDPNAPVPARVRGIIQRQVHHITRLVDDLLDIARLNAGKLELRREPVALEAIVEEVIAACRTGVDARGHLVETAGDTTAVVYGDPIRLVQVLVNLMNNAIKYTDPGGKLRIEYGVDGACGFVRVVDNGRGIPVRLLPTIFDMFVQERTTSDGSGGLGLGLGLVKRLVEMHGGEVRATSEGAGKGSAFEIRLALADAKALDQYRPRKVKALDRPLMALVCDDALDIRALVADLLQLHGHEVTVVEDGPSAIAAIESRTFDVALIDIGLPEMDGYEVARRIRNLGKHVRLIAMTGYSQAADRTAAFDAGFDAHIAKPASAETLLSALQGVPRRGDPVEDTSEARSPGSRSSAPR